MKNTLTLIMLFITIALTSQTLVNNTIDITGGYTPDGYGGNLSYNIIFEESYAKLGLYLSKSISTTENNYEIPYTILSVNGGYFMPLIKNRNESIILSGGLGLLAGYEVVNKGNNELSNGAIIESESNFIYGGFGALDLEFGLNERFYILTNIKEYYHFNSDLGGATLYAGLGMRIYIN
jgi:hypothetical protein